MNAEAPVDFSVVICAYTEDRWEDLHRSVESVLDQRHAAAETIVVVDHNAGLYRRVLAELPGVRAVENDGRQGLSDARNRGVREARAAVVAFLDDDARADPDWLAAMARWYATPGVIGVGGSAEPVWVGTDRPGWFPVEFDWVIGCSYLGLPEEPAPIRNFLGCNMSFRREAFRAAGGFDTSVGRVGTRPVGGEETEFCIRLRRALPGAILMYDPAAHVRHSVPRGRATWRYFRSRCYAEGVSKAIVGRLAGTEAGLASERRHAMKTLPRGMARNIRGAVLNRDPDGMLRAFCIGAGLAITTAGYVVGAVSALVPRRPTRDAHS